jgi:hypothetical protein
VRGGAEPGLVLGVNVTQRDVVDEEELLHEELLRDAVAVRQTAPDVRIDNVVGATCETLVQDGAILDERLLGSKRTFAK